eukprot:4831135-Prymnesium_polylepis.1
MRADLEAHASEHRRQMDAVAQAHAVELDRTARHAVHDRRQLVGVAAVRRGARAERRLARGLGGAVW